MGIARLTYDTCLVSRIPSAIKINFLHCPNPSHTYILFFLINCNVVMGIIGVESPTLVYRTYQVTSNGCYTSDSSSSGLVLFSFTFFIEVSSFLLTKDQSCASTVNRGLEPKSDILHSLCMDPHHLCVSEGKR